MTFLVDTREPWPHPWASFWSGNVRVAQGTLETGDMALAALPDGAVVERKTTGDLLACLGCERERFERELQRSRYVGRLAVVVEWSMADLLALARERSGGVGANAIIGTLAAYQRRFAPFFFAGSIRLAAAFAERFLAGQVRELNRAVNSVRKIDAAPSPGG